MADTPATVIYEYTYPIANNLYYVQSFNLEQSKKTENSKEITVAVGLNESSPPKNILGGAGSSNEGFAYACKSISFPSRSFTMETEKFKHKAVPYIKGIEFPKEVTISWIDNATRDIEKAHLAAFQSWYDYGTMKLKRGDSYKLKIQIYNMDGDKDGTITIDGMIPKTLPNINLSYSNPGNGDTYDVTYSYTKATLDLGNNCKVIM